MKKQARDELEEMFEELGELEEVRALTRKKLLADALRKAMRAQKVTPAEMARRMRTSRPTVYRLLDPAERGATLDTLERASLALGLDLEIRLVPGARAEGRRQFESPSRRNDQRSRVGWNSYVTEHLLTLVGRFLPERFGRMRLHRRGRHDRRHLGRRGLDPEQRVHRRGRFHELGWFVGRRRRLLWRRRGRFHGRGWLPRRRGRRD